MIAPRYTYICIALLQILEIKIAFFTSIHVEAFVAYLLLVEFETD